MLKKDATAVLCACLDLAFSPIDPEVSGELGVCYRIFILSNIFYSAYKINKIHLLA
jgi:hypothetical protein